MVHWNRSPERVWLRQDHLGLNATIDLAGLGVALTLREIYDGVAFPPPLRP